MMVRGGAAARDRDRRQYRTCERGLGGGQIKGVRG